MTNLFISGRDIATAGITKKSAAALVQAAVVCHELNFGTEVPLEVQSALIDAVESDPKLTPYLFSENLNQLFWV